MKNNIYARKTCTATEEERKHKQKDEKKDLQ